MAQGRTRKQQQKRTPTPRRTVAAAIAAEPELVVVMRPQSAFRASAGRFESVAGERVTDVGKLLARHGATLKPIFGPTEERVMAGQAAHSAVAQAPMEDLSVFYKVEVPEERMNELRAQLAKHELVDAAYVKPGVELPRINDMAKAADPTGMLGTITSEVRADRLADAHQGNSIGPRSTLPDRTTPLRSVRASGESVPF